MACWYKYYFGWNWLLKNFPLIQHNSGVSTLTTHISKTIKKIKMSILKNLDFFSRVSYYITCIEVNLIFKMICTHFYEICRYLIYWITTANWNNQKSPKWQNSVSSQFRWWPKGKELRQLPCKLAGSITSPINFRCLIYYILSCQNETSHITQNNKGSW